MEERKKAEVEQKRKWKQRGPRRNHLEETVHKVEIEKQGSLSFGGNLYDIKMHIAFLYL